MMKETELLRQQIDKLNRKDFDLEAWKKYTIVLLARIFGQSDPKIKQIESLEYEHNSWTLRDTSGYDSYLQTCKKLGREILEAAIAELETFGVSRQHPDDSAEPNANIILSALEDELKGSQFKALLKLLKSDLNTEEKKRRLHEIVESLDPETMQTILESILLNDDFLSGMKNQ